MFFQLIKPRPISSTTINPIIYFCRSLTMNGIHLGNSPNVKLLELGCKIFGSLPGIQKQDFQHPKHSCRQKELKLAVNNWQCNILSCLKYIWWFKSKNLRLVLFEVLSRIQIQNPFKPGSCLWKKWTEVVKMFD